MDYLKSIKPGDVIFIGQNPNFGHPHDVIRLVDVKRVTKTQIITRVWRFSRKTGYLIGGGPMTWTILQDDEKAGPLYNIQEEKKRIAKLGREIELSVPLMRSRTLYLIEQLIQDQQPEVLEEIRSRGFTEPFLTL